jgi:hypothetical protein
MSKLFLLNIYCLPRVSLEGGKTVIFELHEGRSKKLFRIMISGFM